MCERPTPPENVEITKDDKLTQPVAPENVSTTRGEGNQNSQK